MGFGKGIEIAPQFVTGLQVAGNAVKLVEGFSGDLDLAHPAGAAITDGVGDLKLGHGDTQRGKINAVELVGTEAAAAGAVGTEFDGKETFVTVTGLAIQTTGQPSVVGGGFVAPHGQMQSCFGIPIEPGKSIGTGSTQVTAKVNTLGGGIGADLINMGLHRWAQSFPADSYPVI